MSKAFRDRLGAGPHVSRIDTPAGEVTLAFDTDGLLRNPTDSEMAAMSSHHHYLARFECVEIEEAPPVQHDEPAPPVAELPAEAVAIEDQPTETAAELPKPRRRREVSE